MNDLFIEILTNNQGSSVYKERFIELEFLSEFGEGKTEEDEIVKKLIFTCEEGVDYSEV
ncbi:MAG: hypothetical protein U9Q29_04015 [Campylobacterota bacterium]|nr:hypothetical protein [Campylobacterota bacterium]